MRAFYSLMLVILLFTFLDVSAQKKCDKEAKKEDGTKISKCLINEWKTSENSNSKEIGIQISTKRRPRKIRTRQSMASINEISSNKNLADTNSNTEVISELVLEEGGNMADKLPFDIVEEVPIFDKCEGDKDKKNCFIKQINKHIQKSFKYPETAFKDGIQGRILVQFVIDKLGHVTEIHTRAPKGTEELQKEAKRIIKSLPKLTAGKQNGRFVKVKFGVPITFRIPGRRNTLNTKKEVKITNAVSFNRVEEIPTFKKCVNKAKKDKLSCFNNEIYSHITEHFYYPEEAVARGIEGKVYVLFIIDKEGMIRNVMVKTPKDGRELGIVAENVVKKLPKFIPGKQNGEPVNVKYVMPMTFKLDN